MGNQTRRLPRHRRQERVNTSLWSRNQKSLNHQFPQIAEALNDLPDGTVVDGDVVAMGDNGRPAFNLLHNFRSEAKRIRFFVFDLLCHQNRDLTGLGLMQRRELLRSLKLTDSRVIRLDYLEASPQDILAAVRAQALPGLGGFTSPSSCADRRWIRSPAACCAMWPGYRLANVAVTLPSPPSWCHSTKFARPRYP